MDKDTVNSCLREAAEQATHTVRTVLEACGLRYAGVIVVAEIPQESSTTLAVDPIQTGCWLCVRDENALPVVKETILKAMNRVEDTPMSRPPEEIN